jgi:hypothetical protein
MRLTAAKTLLLIFSLTACLVSCQKEVDFQNENNSGNPGGGTGNNNTNIIGDWDFVGMTAHTYSAVTVSEGGEQLKAVTTSDYITQNNTGTIQITASDFISTGIGYSIDTIVNSKTYINGVLFDDTDYPFVMTLPPTSSTSPYTRINNDSLTTTGAFGAPDPSGSIPTGLVGMRIAWSGDTLLLKVASSFTQDVTQSGVPGVMTASVSGVSKLKRR